MENSLRSNVFFLFSFFLFFWSFLSGIYIYIVIQCNTNTTTPATKKMLKNKIQ